MATARVCTPRTIRSSEYCHLEEAIQIIQFRKVTTAASEVHQKLFKTKVL